MFTVYILRCRDGSLYTGIAGDLAKRLRQHAEGKGSKYVRSRLPFTLVHEEHFAAKPQAMRREAEIKALSRAKKERLLAAPRRFSVSLNQKNIAICP